MGILMMKANRSDEKHTSERNLSCTVTVEVVVGIEVALTVDESVQELENQVLVS